MTNRTLNRSNHGSEPSWQFLFERYKQYVQYAALKTSAGDRIGAENDLQHAEHFFRSAAERRVAE